MTLMLCVERNSGNEPVQPWECRQLSYVVRCQGRALGYHETMCGRYV